MRSTGRWWLLALAAVLLSLARVPAGAQEPDSLDQDAARIAKQIAPYKGKFVVLVLDVSGSMMDGGRLQKSVDALAKIVREGTRSGDRLAVFSFDDSPELLLKETRIRKDADKKIVIDRIPTVSNNTVGTNIRWAHHEALKLLEPSDAPYQVCILVSDNRHDAPAKEDRYYPQYLQYYVPGTMDAPDTPESKDYARLREKFRGGTRMTFGIGVNVSETGTIQELPPVKKTPPWVWLALAAGLLALAALVWLLLAAAKRAAAARKLAQSPVEVLVRNVTPDAGGARAFGTDTRLELQATDSFTLGGAPFDAGQVVAIPGMVTRDPLARISRQGSAFTIQALVSRDTAAVRVDGTDLEQTAPAAPLRFGQTITIRYKVMAGIEKNVDFLFADAKAVDAQPAQEETVFDESNKSPY